MLCDRLLQEMRHTHIFTTDMQTTTDQSTNTITVQLNFMNPLLNEGKGRFSRQGTQSMINGIIAEGPTIPVIRVVIHDEPLKGDSNQSCVADWVCSLCLNLFLTKLTPVRPVQKQYHSPWAIQSPPCCRKGKSNPVLLCRASSTKELRKEVRGLLDFSRVAQSWSI